MTDKEVKISEEHEHVHGENCNHDHDHGLKIIPIFLKYFWLKN